MLTGSSLRLFSAGLLIAVTLLTHFASAMTVSLVPSVTPPAEVGTMVTWSATVTDAADGLLWYRFRARLAGEEFRIVRDYSPVITLDWTASEREGIYEMELSVRNVNTGDSASTVAQYQVTSRITDGSPVVSPTFNPLVFLYSAPPCQIGGQMSVQFAAADGQVQQTPAKPCLDGLSMNFYLAGLRENSAYTATHIVQLGDTSEQGPALTLSTGAIPVPMPNFSVSQPPQAAEAEGILLQTTVLNYQVSFATDLAGSPVWYYPGTVSFLTRPAPGGFMFGVYQDTALDSSFQILREFDLAGVTTRETNAARVSEQLAAMGKRPITSFHHEAGLLPDGKILTLASTEQMMTGIQGPDPVDVIGDMILVLDRDLQVVWAWDAFDHLDPRQLPVLGEICSRNGGGCPPFYLADRAIDWLHGNSVQLTPDGNLLYSMRHQDWLVKIAYANGDGTGEIIWRLGKGGDFGILSDDPAPWFSHQHDAGFLPDDNNTLMVFDNGNTRRAADSTAHSRGQVIRLDEANRMAILALNADLGAYSLALGSASRLASGNYHFNVGFIQGAANMSRAVEVDPSGQPVYSMDVTTPEYRSFRLRDLYSASVARIAASSTAPTGVTIQGAGMEERLVAYPAP